MSNSTSTVSANATRTVIDIPTSRPCNINQFYSGVVNAIGSTGGCSICCGLDIANIYGPSYGPTVYGITDMTKFWGSGGYSFELPASCPAKINGYSDVSSTDSQRFTKIRSEINNNRPVIIRLVGSDSSTHFVVAYGYTGTGNSTSTIKVLDPARSPTDTGIQTGRDTTLDNAISWSKKTGMNGLRLITGNR